MKELLKDGLNRISDYWRKASQRERTAIALLLAFAIATALVYSSQGIQQVFAAQRIKLERVEGDLDKVALLLQAYLKLDARKTRIEQQFHGVEADQGGYTYLETLVKEEAGGPAGFVIDQGQGRKFGGNYEQTPFKIKFRIKSLEKLVDFLRALVKGEQPFILSRLNIRKSRRRDYLEVESDVNSIRQINEQ